MNGLFRLNYSADRIYGLDILRAFAILFVVAEHGNFLISSKISQITAFFILDGVSVFFVLSGFLIGGILIKLLENRTKDQHTLLNFWIRRWFRTLPNYFFVLILLLIINLIFTPEFQINGNIFQYFIFSQNLFSPHPEFFPEAWSLSIEEWFYLLTPVFLLIIIRGLKLSVKKSLLITIIFILLVVTLNRYLRFNLISVDSVNQWDDFFRKQVFTRLDSLMYGMMGAYLQYYYKSWWVRYKNILFPLGLMGLIIVNVLTHKGLIPIGGLFNCVFSFPVISVSTFLLLPFLSEFKQGSGPVYKIFTSVSLISYSMYLINLTLVQTWIIDKIDWLALKDFAGKYPENICRYSLFWILTIALSILIYKFIELPCMKLRDGKFFSMKRDTKA
jgi:peptidoglycan/LPS O-acetylase OafA/YrhL